MKSRDESRKEVSVQIPSLVSPKHMLKIGAWNVRTMFESGKTAQVMKEMRRYNLNILGLSEVRWAGSGKVILGTGETMYYSGRTDNQHQEGVGIAMDKMTAKSLIEWEPVSARIIRARFYSRFTKMTIIQCYAPTEQAEEEDKEMFYRCLQKQIDKTPRHDLLIVMGDLNAKVGSENSGYEECMGKEGMGEVNENGGLLLDLCRENGLVIGGTVFKHKRIHKLTWTSPDQRTINQIDHMMINQKWRRSLHDVRAVRGADVGSDHYLLLAKVKLKLRRANKTNSQPLFDSQRLRDSNVKEQFLVELKNKFQMLDNIPVDDINMHYGKVKEAYIDTSKKVLGCKKKQRKDWISEGTWRLIEERKNKKRILLATTGGFLNDEYRQLDRLVKRSARQDKRNFVNNLGVEAQEAADRGDTRSVYKITKVLSGSISNRSTVVKDKDGHILSKESDQMQRWAEHFQEVLNRDEPTEIMNFSQTDTENTIEMNGGRITVGEITAAIKQTKGNRAPGEDRVTADMLKADPMASANALLKTFNLAWEQEKVPEDWKKGIIIKLPKKGDLTNCGNWRGINLLSVPGKIFCRVILQRIRQGVEKQLREEQAGFRRGRSCTDQIFVLRNIVEQSIEWNSSLYINYIDFMKAFDSIHHPSLWEIMKIYGLPNKIINIIKNIYDNNTCCVRHEGGHSEWFQVKTGVRQGCIISPLLFLIVIDYVMKTALADKQRGLVWGLFKPRLEDCDFADDIALLSHTHQDIQEKTNRVAETAAKVGLMIHPGKTKLMKVNSKSKQPVTVEGQVLEEEKHFKYLGSIISADSNIEKEIMARIGLAANAFKRLNNIWRSTSLNTKTKVQIYHSNVRSTLLYAAETWRTNKKIESRLRGFEGRCLRRILNVHWNQHVSNEEIWKRTGLNNIVSEVTKRRWTWLGHVLRMKKDRHPLEALSWAPPGKRNRGRPLGTWRRSVEEERKTMGKTWHELRWLAQDRVGWRSHVGAFCTPLRSYED